MVQIIWTEEYQPEDDKILISGVATSRSGKRFRCSQWMCREASKDRLLGAANMDHIKWQLEKAIVEEDAHWYLEEAEARYRRLGRAPDASERHDYCRDTWPRSPERQPQPAKWKEEGF